MGGIIEFIQSAVIYAVGKLTPSLSVESGIVDNHNSSNDNSGKKRTVCVHGGTLTFNDLNSMCHKSEFKTVDVHTKTLIKFKKERM